MLIRYSLPTLQDVMFFLRLESCVSVFFGAIDWIGAITPNVERNSQMHCTVQ